jgi:hypothetical protein
MTIRSRALVRAVLVELANRESDRACDEQQLRSLLSETGGLAADSASDASEREPASV